MRAYSILTFLLGIAGCASSQTYELPKVQRQFAENLVNSESLVQKASIDYRAKKSLYDNLSKGNSPEFKEADPQLAQSLRQMYDLLQEMNSNKKEMTEASGDVASLSYQRNLVYGDDREFALVSEAKKRFEAGNAKLNQALMNYSRESNSMADLISSKKLFFVFDVNEFQKRLQKLILVSQDAQKSMQKELLKAEGYLNQWSKPAGKAEAEALFDQMKNLAGDYSDKAQTLAPLAREMQSASMSQAKVNSLEQIWSEVQKLSGTLDLNEVEMAKLNEQFVKKTESFRKSR